jgi:hypothetical protein
MIEMMTLMGKIAIVVMKMVKKNVILMTETMIFMLMKMMISMANMAVLMVFHPAVLINWAQGLSVKSVIITKPKKKVDLLP